MRHDDTQPQNLIHPPDKLAGAHQTSWQGSLSFLFATNLANESFRPPAQGGWGSSGNVGKNDKASCPGLLPRLLFHLFLLKKPG